MLTAHAPSPPRSTASPRRRPLPSAPSLPAASPTFAPPIIKQPATSPIARAVSPEPTPQLHTPTTTSHEASNTTEVEDLKRALAKAEKRARWVPTLQQQVNDLLSILATMEATLKVHFPDWQTKATVHSPEPTHDVKNVEETTTLALEESQPAVTTTDSEASPQDVIEASDPVVDVVEASPSVDVKDTSNLLVNPVEASISANMEDNASDGDAIAVLPDQDAPPMPAETSPDTMDTDDMKEEGSDHVDSSPEGPSSATNDDSQWAMKRSFSADSIASLATSLVHDAEKTIVENDGLVVDDLEQDLEDSASIAKDEVNKPPETLTTEEKRPEAWRHQFLDVFDGF